MASALDSLTATYTDSEGEDEKVKSDVDEDADGVRHEDDSSMDVVPSLAERLREGGVGTPGSGNSAKSSPKRPQLVSYNDPDAGLSDEDREPVPMDLESDEEERGEDGENGLEKEEMERSHIMEELWSEGVKLPPEPAGNCSRELQEKIEKMWRRKVEEKIDFNHMIQNKKAFRNPSIYEKLILHLNIDELGTNFPPELYDGHLFGKESYYEELAKQQKIEMDKREKAAEQKKKMGDPKVKEGVSTVTQRKSKWDQGSTVGPGLVPGALAATTLSKIIPAFGSLKKK